MEETSACSEGAVSWYIRVSRLAVAVAIIRRRPPEGVRKLAESLAESLKQQDEGWRSKACGLQEDLLRLRQELHLTRVLLKARSSAGAPDDTRSPGEEVVQICQDDTQHLKSDSGCDIDISAHSSEGPCLPLTPPNCQKSPGRKWCQHSRLLKHMQFLQCLCGLHRDYEPALCTDGDDVVWDSVVQLLDSALEIFRQAHDGQPLHRPDLLRHATQVAAQTLSRGKPEQWRSAQRVSRLEDLMKEMICLLLSNHELNAFSVKAVLSDCLMILGGSDAVRPALVQLLMCLIVQLCQQLWDTCERAREEADLQMDWICYENSFYLFWLLEQFAPDTQCDVKQELVTQLENRAFSLSGEFPLFSLYMWRICALFRTVLTQQT